MYFTARERNILEFLILYGETATADFISYFNISERTLRRDIISINDSLANYRLEVIWRSGKIRLNGENIAKNSLSDFLISYYEYSPLEIKCLILNILFSDKTVSLLKISNVINTSIHIVYTNLEEIRNTNGNDFNYVIEKGKGIKVKCNEFSKRKLLNKYYYQLSIDYLLEFIQGFNSNKIEINNKAINKCLDLDLVHTVEEVFRKNAKHSLRVEIISDEDYLRLILYFSISLRRIRENHLLKGVSSLGKDVFNEELYELVSKLLDIVTVDELVRKKENLYFINIYLESIGKKLNSRVNSEFLADKLIKRIEKEYNIDLLDSSIKQDLVTHLNSGSRIQFYGSTFYAKKLVSQIKNEYIDLYKIIEKELLNYFEKDEVTEEQIVYIVLHFGVELISLNNIRTKEILVVCSSGMGSSKMMSAIVKKELNNVNLSTTSVYKLFNEIDLSKYDLVISTVNLGKVLFPYVVVSPVITNDQVMYIKKILNELE